MYIKTIAAVAAYSSRTNSSLRMPTLVHRLLVASRHRSAHEYLATCIRASLPRSRTCYS